jgi:hypothetical protein
MANIFDTLLTIIIGTVRGVTETVGTAISAVQDFFYIKVAGVSFIVLGARQTGKTTLIEWLKNNLSLLDETFNPDPTTAGGDSVPDFNAKVGDTYMRLKPTRDVGGEYAMWETDWVDLFRAAQPRGILFMLDHTDVHLQKDALNFVLQMIDDEPLASKNLKAFYIFVNKSDLWGDGITLDEIMSHYKNEQKRLKAQADRVGYRWDISEGSLYSGRGVTETMKKFFNVIRPKPLE